MLDYEAGEVEAALQGALDQIRTNAPAFERRRNYYAGDHPRVWLTDRLRRLFEEQRHFADAAGLENWCALAVDTHARRLSVKGFTAEVESDAAEAEQLFDQLGLDRDQDELYADVLTVGYGYLIATNAEGGVEVDLQQPENMAWGPQRRSSEPPAWAAKIWADEDENRWRATLYDDTRIWRFVGPRLQTATGLSNYSALPESHRRFELDEEDQGGSHGFARVPVQRFDLGRNTVPIIDTIQNPQDRLNKLTANKMVAAEFAAFRQRYFITQQQFEDGDLTVGPDSPLVLHPGVDGDGRIGGTTVGEFGHTPLENYDKAIDRERDTIFSLASLPRHLNVQKSGAGTSGDAFKAAEGPSIAITRSYQRRLASCWADFYELFGLDVEPDWTPAETRDPSGDSQAVKTLVDAGVPLELALKTVAGWEPELLDELARIKDEQAAAEEAKGAMDRTLNQLQGLGKAGAMGALDPETVKRTAHGLLGLDQQPQ